MGSRAVHDSTLSVQVLDRCFATPFHFSVFRVFS